MAFTLNFAKVNQTSASVYCKHLKTPALKHLKTLAYESLDPVIFLVNW